MSQMYLRRNCNGKIDPEGEIWAVPYRWGSMVIAYKKSKFQKHKLAPIEVNFFFGISLCICKLYYESRNLTFALLILTF